MKNYNGSGIIPLLYFENKLYFIFFIFYNNVITDAGGRKETGDDILETAERELYEESCGLLKLHNLDDNYIYIDISNKGKYYRSHFIIIENIDTKYYDLNLNKIAQYKNNPFLETKGIVLIQTDFLLEKNNQYFMKNNEEKYFMLSNRLKQIMKKIIKRYKSLNKFNEEIIKLLITKKNKLKKKKINISTYEYNTHKKIKIDNITTYSNL